MNAAVVYESQTGSARQYAAWLAEDLGCAAQSIDNLEQAAAGADTVVLCGWFHAATLRGSKPFKSYMAAHPEKRYAVVAVGATPMPDDNYPATEHEKAFRRSFPSDQYPDLPWVYCRGGFHLERLSLPDRIMMRIYFKMLAGNAKRGSKRDAAALEGMKEGFDGCDRRHLAPLIAILTEQTP